MKEGCGNPLHPLPFPTDLLEGAPVQMGNGSQNSTIKERKCLGSRWAPTCSPEECADYSGTGLWQSLNTITKQREMITYVTRVSVNWFQKVVRLKRRIWRMSTPGASLQGLLHITPGECGCSPALTTHPSKLPK